MSSFIQLAIYGFTNGVAYAIFALGLTLILGVMGIINIAHGELYMLGAMIYCSLIYYTGVTYITAAIVSIAVICLVGIICSRIAVEPLLDVANPLLATLLSTLAMSMIFMYSGVLIWGAKTVPAELPFKGEIRLGAFYIPIARIVLSAVGGVVIVLLYLFVGRTRLGKVIRASAQNRLAATLVGINLKRVYSVSFSLAAGLAGLSGVLMAPIWVSNPFMGQLMIVKGFAVVIVGGMGNILGAILIGFLLGIAESFFGYFVSVYFRESLGYALMIIMLMVKPKGLFYR